MMDTLYTPGPWKIEELLGYARRARFVICAPDEDNRVAVISSSGAPNNNFAIEKANARLIAAAPDLLEALEIARPILDAAAASWDEQGNTMIAGARPAWDKVLAAIAKAKS